MGLICVLVHCSYLLHWYAYLVHFFLAVRLYWGAWLAILGSGSIGNPPLEPTFTPKPNLYIPLKSRPRMSTAIHLFWKHAWALPLPHFEPGKSLSKRQHVDVWTQEYSIQRERDLGFPLSLHPETSRLPLIGSAWTQWKLCFWEHMLPSFISRIATHYFLFKNQECPLPSLYTKNTIKHEIKTNDVKGIMSTLPPACLHYSYYLPIYKQEAHSCLRVPFLNRPCWGYNKK